MKGLSLWTRESYILWALSLSAGPDEISHKDYLISQFQEISKGHEMIFVKFDAKENPYFYSIEFVDNLLRRE